MQACTAQQRVRPDPIRTWSGAGRPALRQLASGERRRGMRRWWWRAAKRRGTYLLILITFAFIIPYSWTLYYAVYVMVVNPTLDFQFDYRIRCLSIVLFFTNSSLNFMIYLVQMNDFRHYVRKVFCNKVS